MQQTHCRIVVESLENRSLFSVAIPAALAAEYQAVLTDNVAVRAAVGKLQAVVAGQEAVIAKDVKALGKSKTNPSLLAQVKKAASQYEAAVKGATAKYLAAGGQVRTSELAEAAYEDHATTADTRKWNNAQVYGLRVDSQKLFPLLNLYGSDAADALYAKFSALDAANGDTGALHADLQNAKTALASQIQSNENAAYQPYFDIDTLFDGGEL